MKDEKYEIIGIPEDDCNIAKSFWKSSNIVWVLLFLGIPSALIVIILIGRFSLLGYKFTLGLSIGNGVALFSSGVALSGIIYSNHKNEVRSEKQICEANNRTIKNINNQNLNLEIQMKKAEERLDTQLIEQEKHLKEQLIFDKKEQVLLDIYNILFYNKSSIDTINNNYHSKTKRDESIIGNRARIFHQFQKIMTDVYQFYYIPDKLKNLMTEYIYIVDNKRNIVEEQFPEKKNENNSKEENYLDSFELFDLQNWHIYNDEKNKILGQLLNIYDEFDLIMDTKMNK